MGETVDHAGVPVHPPLFFASVLLLGALIDDRLWRLVIFSHHDWRWLGMIPLLPGLTLKACGCVEPRQLQQIPMERPSRFCPISPNYASRRAIERSPQ